MEFMSCTISDTWVMGLVGTLISWGKDRSVCERDRQTEKQSWGRKKEGESVHTHGSMGLLSTWVMKGTLFYNISDWQA